jgi:hypothetical protein
LRQDDERRRDEARLNALQNQVDELRQAMREVLSRQGREEELFKHYESANAQNRIAIEQLRQESQQSAQARALDENRTRQQVNDLDARLVGGRRVALAWLEQSRMAGLATRWGVKQIQLMLFHDREEIRETLGGGDLLRLRVPVADHLAGKPVSSLEVDGKVRVAGISRGGGGFIPTASSTLQAGDYLILMISKDGLELVDGLTAPEDHQA